MEQKKKERKRKIDLLDLRVCLRKMWCSSQENSQGPRLFGSSEISLKEVRIA